MELLASIWHVKIWGEHRLYPMTPTKTLNKLEIHKFSHHKAEVTGQPINVQSKKTKTFSRVDRTQVLYAYLGQT